MAGDSTPVARGHQLHVKCHMEMVHSKFPHYPSLLTILIKRNKLTLTSEGFQGFLLIQKPNKLEIKGTYVFHKTT